jgi:hypothetical protein
MAVRSMGPQQKQLVGSREETYIATQFGMLDWNHVAILFD